MELVVVLMAPQCHGLFDFGFEEFVEVHFALCFRREDMLSLVAHQDISDPLLAVA